MNVINLTEDEFYEKFNCVKNHLDDNAAFDGCMFETFGQEVQYVVQIARETPNKVWTIGECDGVMYYESGYHLVNRLGYFITEEEIEEDTSYFVELEGCVDEPDANFECTDCCHTFNEKTNNGKGCPFCGGAYFQLRNYKCNDCGQFIYELIEGKCPHCQSEDWVENVIE